MHSAAISLQPGTIWSSNLGIQFCLYTNKFENFILIYDFSFFWCAARKSGIFSSIIPGLNIADSQKINKIRIEFGKIEDCV